VSETPANVALSEDLRAAMPIVMLVGGLALSVPAGYLYVAAPQEHTDTWSRGHPRP
jgi:hypothetical protein